jgi:hypothetical protein
VRQTPGRNRGPSLANSGQFGPRSRRHRVHRWAFLRAAGLPLLIPGRLRGGLSSSKILSCFLDPPFKASCLRCQSASAKPITISSRFGGLVSGADWCETWVSSRDLDSVGQSRTEMAPLDTPGGPVIGKNFTVVRTGGVKIRVVPDRSAVHAVILHVARCAVHVAAVNLVALGRAARSIARVR